MKLSDDLILLAGSALVVLVLLEFVRRTGVSSIAAAAGGAAVEAVDGAIGGAVNGIGDIVGLPRTDETECDKAIREGRTWDASFACPAKRFIGYVFN